MPAPPLLDFDSLDLSRVVVGSDEVRQLCQQRNRMAMLDGVLRLDASDGVLVGFKDVGTDDWWATDHFPGRPIFPGALQIEGAAQLCSYHFLTRYPEAREKIVGFGGVDGARFRGVVTPPARMVFAARPLRVRPSMFTYQTQGFVDRKLVFEAEILGVII